MPITAEWYTENVAGPVSQDDLVKRGREMGLNEPRLAALTMARETDILSSAAETGDVPFNFVIGMQQVTAFAVSLSAQELGGVRFLGPLSRRQVDDFYTTYKSVTANAQFPTSGNPLQDMKRVEFVIAAQVETDTHDRDPDDREKEGVKEYREGIQLGLNRWAELTASGA